MTWNDVWTGDCERLMRRIHRGQVDLLFADPPFNIGYEYEGYNDARPRDEYLRWTADWICQAAEVLSPTGTMWVAIGDDYAAEVKIRLDAAGLHMRNWVVWHYGFGVACQNKFSRSHTHLLYYTADRGRFTFNPDAVRVRSARQETYADPRANPDGKLPDDVWTFSRVCGTFKERRAHPCQMPEDVLSRIIRACSNPGDVVLDPFCGSGTSIAVAKKLGRRYLGIELSPDYADNVRKRLDGIREPMIPG